MKELTIEQKAQRYDEAIERAKAEYEDDDRRFRATLERIFPELKESEDERIRKKLLSSFKDIMADADEDELWYGLPYNDIISWLEKQGNNINCIYDKELSELLHIVICRYVNDPDISYIERENVSKKIFPYVELLEKQGEQKPTIFIPKFRVGDIVKSKSQPMLDARKIISIGKDYYLCEDRGCIGFAWEDDCELVEPKQEWSEEDETYSNHVITAIKSYYTDDLGEENPWREELLRWLKSLRPQLTWKPSKEQMITLRHVISGCSYDIDPLVELETKLKEL